MISSVISFIVVAFLAIVVLGVTLTLLGVALTLLFKVVPLILIGYLALRLLGWSRRRQISAEDQKWLEG